MTEAHACKQLAQGCYPEADRPTFEPATFWVASKRSTVTPHKPFHSLVLALITSEIGLQHVIWPKKSLVFGDPVMSELTELFGLL